MKEIIIGIIKLVLPFIFTSAIPAFFVYLKNKKKIKEAKTNAEKEKLLNEMKQTAQNLIVSAEETYKSVDEFLKSQGKSAGSLKKESVMSKLQLEVIEHGISFDFEYWSKVVDDIVSLTKKVN